MIEYELEPLDREMRPDSDLRHAGLSNRETVTRTALELLAAGTPIGIPGREVTCIWVDKRMGPQQRRAVSRSALKDGQGRTHGGGLLRACLFSE